MRSSIVKLGVIFAAVTLNVTSHRGFAQPEVPYGKPSNVVDLIKSNLLGKTTFDQDKTSLDEPNYFRAQGGIFLPSVKIDTVETSDILRWTETILYGWTCVRLSTDGKIYPYAVFIQDNEIVDARFALVVDHCEQGKYTVLPRSSNRPKTSKNEKRM